MVVPLVAVPLSPDPAVLPGDTTGPWKAPTLAQLATGRLMHRWPMPTRGAVNFWYLSLAQAARASCCRHPSCVNFVNKAAHSVVQQPSCMKMLPSETQRVRPMASSAHFLSIVGSPISGMNSAKSLDWSPGNFCCCTGQSSNFATIFWEENAACAPRRVPESKRRAIYAFIVYLGCTVSRSLSSPCSEV